MITIENLSKSYGDIKALNNISFEVKEGELFGLIGPDGAGKTTLFRILTTLLLPDEGEASINEYNVQKDFRQIRNSIGYMPERFSLYQDLSVEENLEFFASAFGTTIKENYDLIKDIYEQIEPFKKRKAGALSGGMKQKLALCCALIHKPKTLFLDEPTTGVDPVSRRDFWKILKDLKKAKITILVSTPFMDEAAMCERIALINKGSILNIDTADNIKNHFGKDLYAVQSSKDMFTLIKDLQNYKNVNSAHPFGKFVHYTDKKEKVDVEMALSDYLRNKHHNNIEIFQIEPTIEDTFMEYMLNEEAK